MTSYPHTTLRGPALFTVVVALVAPNSAQAIPLGASGENRGYEALVIDPGNDRLYTCMSGDTKAHGVLSVVDRRTTQVLRNVILTSGEIYPDDVGCLLALDRTTHRLYAAMDELDNDSPLLRIIETDADFRVTNIELPFRTVRMALFPETNTIYLLNLGGVDIFDTVTNSIIGHIDIPDLNISAFGTFGDLIGSPDQSRLYVLSSIDSVGESGAVVVVDTLTNTIVGRRTVAAYSRSLALNERTRRLFVLSAYMQTAMTAINVFDARSMRALDDIAAPARTISMAVNQITNSLYVASGSGCITIGLGPAGVRTTRSGCGDRLVVDSGLRRFYATSSFGALVVQDDELLSNPAFELTRAYPWPGLTPTGWTRRNLDPADGTSAIGYDGTWAMRFFGAASRKALVQDVATGGAAGTVLHVEGFSKAADALEPGAETGAQYCIKVTLRFEDGMQQAYTLAFAGGTHDWERVSRRIVAPKDFTGFTVRLVYANQSGSALFDALRTWFAPPPSANAN